MRIINNTIKGFALTDLDRGISGDVWDVYENYNGKSDIGVPAASGAFIDILDTDKVLLSTYQGQVKKFVDKGWLSTEYSITGREVGPFVIGITNNIFEVQIGTSGVQSFTLPSGTAITMTQIVNTINASATGFVAAESTRFFRFDNVDNTQNILVEGDLGYGYGQRTPSIVSGFLVLHGTTGTITIGPGTANDTLGFYAGEMAKCK